MRHSSWTLFLIPLTLPAVLLCLPGARQSVDENGSAVQDAPQVRVETPMNLSVPAILVDPGDGSQSNSPEALFQE